MECIEDPDYLYIQLKNNKASLPDEWIVGKLHFLDIGWLFAAALCHSQWIFHGKVTSPSSGMRAAGKVSQSSPPLSVAEQAGNSAESTQAEEGGWVCCL